MTTISLKSILFFILLIAIIEGGPTGKKDADSPQPGETKDPAKTNIRNNNNVMIMKNGVITNENQYDKNERILERKHEKEEHGEEGELKILTSDQNKANTDQSKTNNQEKKPAASKTKRFMYDRTNNQWDKAIVPYVFDPSIKEDQAKDVMKVMALYEYWTCFRFVPWDNTTQSKYDLSHNNYIHFVRKGGCWSFVGNIRKTSGGQDISPCGGSTTVHEIGHAIGFNHEQKLPDRSKYVRINPENIAPNGLSQYTVSSDRKDLHREFPYNINSRMHYSFWMFNVGGRDTMTPLDPRYNYLVGQRDQKYYYMFREAVSIYKCKELKCPDFKMKCENDGYVSYINSKCSCRCIKGLDPKTGCTTMLREDKKEQSQPWPYSRFAFLRPLKAPCPEDAKQGSITHKSDGGWTSDNYQAMGDHDTQHFCTFNHQNRNAKAHQWPAGEYCISRVNGRCPEKACPDGWKYNKDNHHCYRIYHNTEKGYGNSERFCEQLGAYLVTITDKDENNFVNGMRKINTAFLIGLNDKTKEGTWVWRNGEEMKYSNWKSGQPDNWKDNEDCAMLSSYSFWVDVRCNYASSIMCEMAYPEFQEGSIEFEDDSVTKTGVLPDVVSGSKTKLEFCCRQDGNIGDAIALPTANKFTLWQTNKEGCQRVKDTISVSSFFAHRMKTGKEVIRTGFTPLSYNRDNVGYAYFCVYQPIKRDCGEIVELTETDPEKAFTSPYYPHSYHTNRECTWFIKSPPKTRIVMHFETFEIPSYTSDCEDSLEIRFSLPEHPGVKYCGSGFKAPIYSEINYMNVILDTKAYKKGKKFKAIVKMIKDEDLCYYPKDKGTTYRGKVAFSRNFKSCLPWSSVTNCPHNPDNDMDKDKGLVQNYCRNPDSTAQPWCYIESKGCIRDYCDVCGTGVCLDLLDNCDTLLKENSEYCSDTSKTNGIVVCAKSCGFCDKQEKKKYTEITCSVTSIPENADAVDTSVKSLHVGKALEYKYQTNPSIFAQTCLSDGTLTKKSKCPAGWILVNNKCIKSFVKKLLGRYMCDRLCEEYGGNTVIIKNEEEQNVVQRLTKLANKNLVIGLEDRLKEGTFKWYNGETMSYEHFQSGEPNNYDNEDCIFMRPNGNWNDVSCQHTFDGVVCQIETPVDTCEDGTLHCEKFKKVKDVAKGKKAEQSSSYNGNSGPEQAVNDNWKQCTHTHTEDMPWWKIDLETVYTIKKVVLVNRQESWGSRLRNLVVTIGESENDMKECVKYEGPGKNAEQVELLCTSPLKGRYLKVQIQERGILTLCEVKVFAYTE